MLRITNLPMTDNTVHGQIRSLSINKLYQHASIINHYSNRAKPSAIGLQRSCISVVYLGHQVSEFKKQSFRKETFNKSKP